MMEQTKFYILLDMLYNSNQNLKWSVSFLILGVSM